MIGLLSSAMGKSIGRQKRLAESVQLHGQYCIKSDLPQMEWGRYNETMVDGLTDENLVSGALVPYSCYENPLLVDEEERFMQCQCLPDYGHFEKVGSPTKICTWKPLGRVSGMSYMCDKLLLTNAVAANAENFVRIKGELTELTEELVQAARDEANTVSELIKDNEKAICQLHEDLKNAKEESIANDKIITMEVNSKWQDMLATHFMRYELTELETSRQITEAWNELQLNLTEEITVRTLQNKRQVETMAKAYIRQKMEDVTGWAHTHVYERLRDIWGDNTVIANDPTDITALVDIYGSGVAGVSVPAPTLANSAATDGTLAKGGLLTELAQLIADEKIVLQTNFGTIDSGGFLDDNAPTAGAQQIWYEEIRDLFYDPDKQPDYKDENYTPCTTTCAPDGNGNFFDTTTGDPCIPADCDEVNIALEILCKEEKDHVDGLITEFKANYEMKIELAKAVEQAIKTHKANNDPVVDDQMKDEIAVVLKTKIAAVQEAEIVNFYDVFRNMPSGYDDVYDKEGTDGSLAESGESLGANSVVTLMNAEFDAAIEPLEDRIRAKLEQAEKDMAKKNKIAREDAIGQAWLYVQDLQTQLQHKLTSDMNRERHKISNGLWERKQRLRTDMTKCKTDLEAKIAAADLTNEEPMEAKLGEVSATADKGMAKAEEHVAQIQATSLDRLYKQGNFSVELIGDIKSAISDKIGKLIDAVQFEMTHSRNQIRSLRQNHFY